MSNDSLPPKGWRRNISLLPSSYKISFTLLDGTYIEIIERDSDNGIIKIESNSKNDTINDETKLFITVNREYLKLEKVEILGFNIEDIY